MEHVQKISNFFFLFLVFINTSSLFANTNKTTQQYAELPISVQNNYLVKEQLKQDCNKIQVVEFFSYACPACYKIEPEVQQFKDSIKNNDNIIFKKFPVVFHEAWKNSAKLFLTIDKLNINDKFQSYVFNVIQNDISNNLTEYDIRKIIDNFNQKNPNNKINGKEFIKVFNLNIINRDVKNAMRLFYALNLTGTPVFIVNAKYIVSPQYFKKAADIFKTINKLASSGKIICSNEKKDY